jgi:hypothetical protein
VQRASQIKNCLGELVPRLHQRRQLQLVQFQLQLQLASLKEKDKLTSQLLQLGLDKILSRSFWGY